MRQQPPNLPGDEFISKLGRARGVRATSNVYSHLEILATSLLFLYTYLQSKYSNILYSYIAVQSNSYYTYINQMIPTILLYSYAAYVHQEILMEMLMAAIEAPVQQISYGVPLS
jgi:hypothetical protein